MMPLIEAPSTVRPRRPAYVGPGRFRAMETILAGSLAGILLFSAIVAAPLIAGDVTQGRARGPAPEGMVWVPGGSILMPAEGARPAHWTVVRDFWMDRHDVKEEDFARFVAATGYVPSGQKPAAGQPAECEPKSAEPRPHARSILPKEDARAYADWAGKRLPTDIEREWIRQKGLVAKDDTPDGRAWIGSLGVRCVKSAR